MKKYVVIEKNKTPGFFEIINQETTSVDNIWYNRHSTLVKDLKNSKLKPLIFTDFKEATKYKNKQQKFYKEDWVKWGLYFKHEGQKKPKWQVVEYKDSILETIINV